MVSAVINKPSFSVDNTKKSAIISSAVLASGIVTGSLIYIVSKTQVSTELWELFTSFCMDFSNKNKPEIISGLVMQNLAYYSLMLIFAVSAFGTPAVFFLSFIKTLGLGMLTTYIYDTFALKGIEYCLLVLLPGKIILLFAMVLLTQNCYIMSLDIYRSLRNKSDRAVEFKKFSLRALLILILILVSSLIDFILVISFSSLFDFG